MRKRTLAVLALLALAGAPATAQFPYTILETGLSGSLACPFRPYARLSLEFPLADGLTVTPEGTVAWAGPCAHARAALVLAHDEGPVTLMLSGWTQVPLAGGAWDAGASLAVRVSFGGE